MNISKLYNQTHIFGEILDFIQYTTDISTQPNIYLIRIPTESGEYIYKLGYATDIDKRVRKYTDNTPTAEVCGLAYSEGGIEDEQEIHNNFDSICRNEWYTEEVIKLIIPRFTWCTQAYWHEASGQKAKEDLLNELTQEDILKRVNTTSRISVKPTYASLSRLLTTSLDLPNPKINHFRTLAPDFYEEIIEAYLVVGLVGTNRITNLKAIIQKYRGTLAKHRIVDLSVAKEFDVDF